MANIVDIAGALTSFNTTTATQMELGQLGRDAQGNLYRWCLAGAVDLVAGNVIQGPAQIANHLALTPTLASGGGGTIGDVQLVVTLGATAAATNLYAEGWWTASTAPGNGITYKIKGHASVLSSGVLTANLGIDTPVQVALTSSSRVDLQQNTYSNVIQSPVTTATCCMAGVAPIIIKAAAFGWLQTHGPCSTLITGTPAVGAQVVGTGAVAGAAAIASSTLGVIGFMMSTGVDTKNNFVYLTID